MTVVTQIGGAVYLISLLVTRKRFEKFIFLKKLGVFILLYVFSAFVLTPNIAPIFGRERIKESELVQAHSFFYKLANRNYVRPQLNLVIDQVASQYAKRYKGIKFIYLDANFPFIDGFPLLPHLSHNDGKKIDITLVYEEEKEMTNKKPSVSGYGIYEEPTKREHNRTQDCKKKGYWQYDFTKYLSFGHVNKEITFSKKGTRYLVKTIVKQDGVGKLLIEPHLKKRLGLASSKVRFHGCRAVRHDDHIHFQLK